MGETSTYIGSKSLKSCLRRGSGKSTRWSVVRLAMFLATARIHIETRSILRTTSFGPVIEVIILWGVCANSCC